MPADDEPGDDLLAELRVESEMGKALQAAARIGYPVMLKSTAGGGGMTPA